MGVANNLISGIRRLILLAGLLFSVLQVNGQAWLERPVTLNETLATRASLLFQVSEQAEVGMAFINEWPEFKQRITITTNQLPVREVLQLIFSGTSLTYEATEHLFSISRKKIILSGYLEDARSGERLVCLHPVVNEVR